MAMKKADLKAKLAARGLDMKPDANFQVVRPPQDGPVSVVVLDRVGDGTKPDYCTHGYASCVRCGELCWMGHETSKPLEAGEAYAICLECADAVIPQGTPHVHLNDPKRWEGHE